MSKRCITNKQTKKNTKKASTTTSINGTPTPPTSQQQQNHQTNKSEDFVHKQQKIVEELMERVDHLEGTASAMEGELTIVRDVNTLFSRQLEEADSYPRRSCMIVTGL